MRLTREAVWAAMRSMTAYAIQNRLFEMLDRKGHELIIPNYTPARWYESDLFSMTKAGYSVEHEIKLTAQDFERDAVKDGGRKHQRLAGGDPDGPKFFWFVVPEGLVDKIKVPKWAGLKTARMHGRKARIRIAKQAPALHNHKPSPGVAEHIQTLYYWRFWALRRK